MTLSLPVDGVNYPYPEAHDKNWAVSASALAQAVANALAARLGLAGGTLTGALTLAGAPTLDLHAVTKAYVDALMLGLKAKTECRLATTANVNLASALANGQTLDGQVIATGNRILVKNQTDPLQNGIYVAPASGAASRATDADVYAELFQALVSVLEGTANAGKSWVSQTTSTGTIGVDAVTFAQINLDAVTADGQGIEKSGSTLSLELDGATLSKSASGLRVADLGVLDAHIGAAAAMARSKLAAGAVNRLVGNDASGVMVDVAAIPANRLLASDANGLPAALAAITASRALASDASGFPVHSAATAAELDFLAGVSSGIQAQINAKLGISDVLGRKTIDVPASAMETDGVDEPVPFWKRMAAGGAVVAGYSFSSSVAKYVYFSLRMPKAWSKSALQVTAIYMHEGGQTAGLDGVVWQIAAHSFASDEAMTATFGSGVDVTADQANSNRLHVTNEGSLTVAGTPATGEIVHFRATRKIADALDDLNVAAILHKLVIQYTVNAANDS